MSEDLTILAGLCDVPTAPYAEAYVVAYIRHWAGSPERKSAIEVRTDAVGNLQLLYRAAADHVPELVLEAHMDHPGFLVEACGADGEFTAIFRGGVKPSCFAGAKVQFWLPDAALKLPHDQPLLPAGRWLPARVAAVEAASGTSPIRAKLAWLPECLPEQVRRIGPGSIGMWALPDSHCLDRMFAARVCDDLAGAAVGLYVLDRLIDGKVAANVRLLLTRAEEVGFAGALAAAVRELIPAGCAVIGIETSRAMPHAPQGRGPVIRVGDKTMTFSPSLTRFISMRAGGIADQDNAFAFQRQLMDGGTCDSTAFAAFGYDAAAVCLALGNYHNMADADSPAAIPTAGAHIAAETIHLDDFFGLVRLLTDVAANFSAYAPDHGALRQRLLTMYEREQKRRLESFDLL